MVIQRIRDPLHDLIEFENSELERTLWKVIQTRPLFIQEQATLVSLTAWGYFIPPDN